VTVSSGPRLGGDVRVTPPPSARGKSRPLSEVSDDAFFSAGSRTSSSDPHATNSSSFYSLTSTSSEDQQVTTTGLITDETAFEFTSGGSNTQIVPSTLSYRGTESNSYLGDSHDGSYTYSYTPSYTPTSPSRTTLSRSSEVRRRGYTSRSYTYSEETSDKENSSGYTPATRSTLSTWTRSRSTTPTPTPSASAHSAPDEPASSGSEGYDTAHSPSTASFKSLPTIPSESDYSTAELCKTDASTEYVTAEKCVSDISTEYITAEVCKTETETEYITAEVCPSEPSTQYETASLCKTIPSEASTPRSVHVVDLPRETEAPPPPVRTPSVVSSVLSPEIDIRIEVVAEEVPPPPSDSTPSSISSDDDVISQEHGELSTASSNVRTSDISFSLPSLESVPSVVQPLPSLSPVSSVTESSEIEISELPASVTEISTSSVSTPSVHASHWAPETDISFDSSLLQPTPSTQSVQLHEGRDVSFETSFMRASPSPLSSFARLTPITESMSSSTPSSPLPSPSIMPPVPPSISSPTSAPTPFTISDSTQSLSESRTPSSVSDVSSISVHSGTLPEIFEEMPSVTEISTEPSLLSTNRSPVSLHLDTPAMIPLPESPAPPSMSATSVSMSVSMSTPRSEIPSIHSDLETEPTRTHTEIVTHDIDRLLQHIHEIDLVRGQENEELSATVREIREELYDLSDFMRSRAVGEVPPPVPRKDRSVGGSSIISEPRVTPSGPRVPPYRVPIALSPPRSRPSSPSSSISGSSYLSSHHSEDFSFMESEAYLIPPASPSWPSPSSPSSSTSSAELTPSMISSSSSSPSPGPSLSVTSSSSPTHPPSSPTPSTASSSTARPVDGTTITTLRDLLHQLREQTSALWEGQVSTNHMLDELRQQRVGPQDNIELHERLHGIETLLSTIMERRTEIVQPPLAPPPEAPSSSSESHTDALSDLESLHSRWEAINRSRSERIPIHAPAPRTAGPSLDEQLLELLGAPTGLPLAGVQPPPSLIPFTYQPAPRMARSRSTSPILRPGTFPVTMEPVNFSPEHMYVRPPRPPRPPRRPVTTTEPSEVYPSPLPVSTPLPGSGVGVRPPFTEGDLPERRPNVPPALPVLPPLHDTLPARPPTAPAGLGSAEDGRDFQSWYRPRPGTSGGPAPPPGSFGPARPTDGGPTFVPMPPGPTVVQLPLFDTLMAILREHRLAQLATVDQQRELMRYMHGLNEWLERDVQDRQAELRGVSARVDQLREDLGRFGMGIGPVGVQPPPFPSQPPTQQGPGPFIVPPVPQATVLGPIGPPPVVGSGYPEGFVPQSGRHHPPVIPHYDEGGHRPPVIPHYDDRATPTPSDSPVIPGDPRWGMGMPEPQLPYGPPPPVIPPGFYPDEGYHDPRRRHDHRRPAEDDGDEHVIPTRPSSSSGSRSPIAVPPPGQTQPIFVNAPPTHIVVEHSHRSRSDSLTSDSQHSFHPPHSAGMPAIGVPMSQADIPAVVPVGHSGSYSNGSPPHQTIVINQPPQPGMQGPIMGGPVPIQGSDIPGQFGYPDQGIPQQQWQGTPVVVNPPPMNPPVAGGPILVGTRSSSRGSSRTHHHDEPIIVNQPGQPPPTGPTQIFINPTDGGRHSEHGQPSNIIIRSPTHGSEYGDPGIHRRPSSHGYHDSAGPPVVVQVPSPSQQYYDDPSRPHRVLHRSRHGRSERSRSYSPSEHDEGHPSRRAGRSHRS
ncbi:hypothetical protein BJ138DRAFT_67873, partial [Hygrophoropsis aurantiaca]